MDSKQKEILDALDISEDDFTAEQLRKFEKAIRTIPNPKNMTAEQAMNLVNTVGIDIEALQKKFRKYKASQIPKKQKIPRNGPCICGSNKKYKHCCINK